MHSFYLFFVFFLTLLTLPGQAIIALLILVTSGLPILYRQRRVGKDGKVFVMYKFRTMRVGAEKDQTTYKKYNEADGPVFKINDDPRFTPIGKFLSHTGLDELPQLFNVIQGDMALIGPRPLPVAEAAKLTRAQQARHAVKPGIISPWILTGYHRNSFADWMNSDLTYVQHKSPVSDSILLVRAMGLLGQLFWQELFVARKG